MPVSRRRPRRGRAAAQRLARDVLAARDRIAPLLPDMDPGDLLLILEAMLRPPGTGRRIFIREIRPGVYVA